MKLNVCNYKESSPLFRRKEGRKGEVLFWAEDNLVILQSESRQPEKLSPPEAEGRESETHFHRCEESGREGKGERKSNSHMFSGSVRGKFCPFVYAKNTY